MGSWDLVFLDVKPTRGAVRGLWDGGAYEGRGHPKDCVFSGSAVSAVSEAVQTHPSICERRRPASLASGAWREAENAGFVSVVALP